MIKEKNKGIIKLFIFIRKFHTNLAINLIYREIIIIILNNTLFKIVKFA